MKDAVHAHQSNKFKIQTLSAVVYTRQTVSCPATPVTMCRPRYTTSIVQNQDLSTYCTETEK